MPYVISNFEYDGQVPSMVVATDDYLLSSASEDLLRLATEWRTQLLLAK